MFQYTLTKISPLGEDDPKYGQKWWGQAENVDVDISFNLTGGKVVHSGSVIEAEVSENRQTTKGKPYQLLRKVKVVGGSEFSQLPQVTTEDFAPPSPTQPLKTANPLDIGTIEGQLRRVEEGNKRIEDMLKKLLNMDEPTVENNIDKFLEEGEEI